MKGGKATAPAPPPSTPPIEVPQAAEPDLGGIPKEWRQARAAKADEWFQQQKEELHRRYWADRQAVKDAATVIATAAAESAAFDARVQGMVREQQAFSRSVQQQLSVMRRRRLAANLEYQALRLPHFTPPRPLALLTAPGGGTTLRERLFTRALATSLMAAVGLAPEGGAAGGAGDAAEASGLGGGGLGGGSGVEAVWCEMGQSRISLQDPPLARAEALERCRVAVVVLSPALLASPTWPLERRILTARLASPPGAWPGPPLAGVIFVRLHVPPPRSAATAAAAAAAGQGRKAAAAAAAASAAAAAPDPEPEPPLVLPTPVPGYPVQTYPVTVLDMTVPQPPEPAAEGAEAAAALAQAVRGAVSEVLAAAAASGALATAGLRLMPDLPPVYLHPAHLHGGLPEHLAAVAAASSGGGAEAGSLLASLRSTLGASGGGAGSLATQLLVSPATAALAPGAAATAAHLLPAAHIQRAVEDWTVYDTAVCLSGMGRSVARWSSGFTTLGVDGPLLAVADADDLRECCGVAAEGARNAIAAALASALHRPAALPPSRALLPGPDAPSAPLPPEAAVLPWHQREAVLADIAAYYDQDHSGDLNAAELGRLLEGCGLRLSEERVKDVLDDYDADSDGLLCWSEAEALLADMWRLVMGQQDLAAWTPAEAADELKDAVDLEWPLETPRATPDAERTAAGAAARRANASAGGIIGGGSETASINIVGSGAAGAASATSRLPSAAAPSVAATAASSPRMPPGTAMTGFTAAFARGGGGSAGGSSYGGATSPPGSAPGAVEGEDEAGAVARLVDNTGIPPTTAATAGSPGSRSDSDGNSSLASYAWGLPPRLSLAGGGRPKAGAGGRAGGGKGGGGGGTQLGDGSSVVSGSAPWAGAITPRVPKTGGLHMLSAAEMAARDVDVKQLMRRERTEAELRESLRTMLGRLDLRRAGRVELQLLRAALASGGPPNQLSPLHTQLLSDLADAQAQPPTVQLPASAPSSAANDSLRLLASGPLGEALLGLEVAVQPYIASAVQGVVSEQAGLMTVVYGDRGLSPMLRQFYRQGAGPDDPLELLTQGPRVHADAAEEALGTLFDVQGLKPTALLRAALLPHHQLDPPPANGAASAITGGGDAATADGAAIVATPLSLASARHFPQSWASATAHMLHVYQTLQRHGF